MMDSGVKSVCAIINRGGYNAMFVLDIDGDGDGDGDVDEIVDLDFTYKFEDKFQEKEPNVEIMMDSLCFCGFSSKLYVFEGICNDSKPLGIYEFALSHHLSSLTNLRIDSTSSLLRPIARMNAPKLGPASVRCNLGILVFSTEIAYHQQSNEDSSVSDSDFDFELFDPLSGVAIPLPPLRVGRRQSRIRDNVLHFQLMISSGKERVRPPYSYVRFDRELKRSSFNINLFSVIDNCSALVVGTDFGALFYLDIGEHSLSGSDWQVYDGPSFPNLHHNIVTSNNEVVLGPHSASTFYRHTNNTVVKLPLCARVTPRYSWRNCLIGASGHGEYTVGVVQVGFDATVDQAYWTLDVVRLDASKLGEEERDEIQIARRIKSFKFVGDEFNFMFIPECLHFF